MKTPPFDIVIPCYNPPEGWVKQIIGGITKLTEELGVGPNVILVNDGSSKGITNEHVNELKASIEHLTYHQYEINKGKGHALREGVKQSVNDIVLFTDIDFPYTSESVCGIYKELANGADVALGTRSNKYYDSVPAFRTWLSKTFRWVLKKTLRLKSDDTQCGLKGFRSKGKEEFLATSIDRFLFDLEFVLYCSRNNNIALKTKEVQLRPGVEFSKMPIKVLLSEAMNFFKILFGRVKKKG